MNDKGDGIFELYGQIINKAQIITVQCQIHPQQDTARIESLFNAAIVAIIEKVNREGEEAIINIEAYIITTMDYLLINGDTRDNREISVPEDRIIEQDPGQVTSLDMQMLLKEQTWIGIRAIMRLPKLHGKAIIGYYIDGLSYKEIADLMEITHDDAKRIIQQGREKLRNDPEIMLYCADCL